MRWIAKLDSELINYLIYFIVIYSTIAILDSADSHAGGKGGCSQSDGAHYLSNKHVNGLSLFPLPFIIFQNNIFILLCCLDFWQQHMRQREPFYCLLVHVSFGLKKVVKEHNPCTVF
ncbi:hypothetical protein ACJX0J_015566 [Zea mays]